MEVTIDVQEVVVPPYREEARLTLFGRQKTVRIPQTPGHHWEVHLTLLPTEEERAIIQKYKLAELTVEEVPAYSPAEIQEAEIQYQNATTEDRRLTCLRVLEERRYTKIFYTLENYFDNPFKRSFSHPIHAHAYVDELTGKIIPQIKSNLEYYADRGPLKYTA